MDICFLVNGLYRLMSRISNTINRCAPKILRYIAVLVLFQANVVCAVGVIIGNGIDSVTVEQVRMLYRGQTTTIAGKVVHLTDSKPLQKEFLEKIVGKSIKKYKKDWLRMLFADGVVIPLEFQTSEEVIAYIKRTPHSLGYVPLAPVEVDSIKVLIKF